MLHLENLKHQELLSELSPDEAANINGGQATTPTPTPTPTPTQGTQDKFNQDKYLQALGVAYINPPGFGTITNDEALLAQYLGWQKSGV